MPKLRPDVALSLKSIETGENAEKGETKKL
jgi:hypothetical protein